MYRFMLECALPAEAEEKMLRGNALRLVPLAVQTTPTP